MTTKITVFDNGPIKMEGDFQLHDMEGKPLSEPNKATFLCRCGASENKPFCDGKHKKVSFKSQIHGK